MKVRNFKPLVAVALVAGSLGTIAAPTDGLYAGASLGTSQYPDTVNGVTGNQVNPNFAVELGVAKLGDVSSSSGQMNGRSEFLDAVGTLPLSDKWSLLGRVGVAHVDLNTSLGNDSGNGLKVGLGAQYSLTSNVAIRGEWERYQMKVFDATTNADQYTIGLRVAF